MKSWFMMLLNWRSEKTKPCRTDCSLVSETVLSFLPVFVAYSDVKHFTEKTVCLIRTDRSVDDMAAGLLAALRDKCIGIWADMHQITDCGSIKNMIVLYYHLMGKNSWATDGK